MATNAIRWTISDRGRCARLIAALLICLSLASGQADAAEPGAPADLGDGWKTAAPEKSGFDTAKLEKLDADIRAGMHGNIHAVLIERNGALVYERYYEGPDENWGDPLGVRKSGPAELHDLRSVTKSVTSLLLGIALGEDFERDLGMPLPELFPEYRQIMVPEAANVTLEDVLTMRSGLQWNEMHVPYTSPENDEVRMIRSADPIALVLARPVVEKPGTRWDYNGGNTQILSKLIESRTGQRIDRFAESTLFAALGIGNYEWRRGFWGPEFAPSAASGLRLGPRDLAKIGSLVLNDGKWNGTQVVPEAWMHASLERRVAAVPWLAGTGIGYGFMWYTGPLDPATGPDIAMAIGYGQQRLFVVPELGLSVTVLAALYRDNRHQEAGKIFRRILAAQKRP
ncbi:serine hydrolase domain-containing protein [Nisaea sediminum]|uniref:serine hydrolase domain-containing protein n=1 Tax=Nisaea sediminum TaxID=2775867 RepID=UPI0018661545|nr:serine hydrolase [Nisaea sediminum]